MVQARPAIPMDSSPPMDSVTSPGRPRAAGRRQGPGRRRAAGCPGAGNSIWLPCWTPSAVLPRGSAPIPPPTRPPSQALTPPRLKARSLSADALEADPEAEEAAYQEALAAGRVRDIPLELAAGRIAESLPTGPGLAGWLAQARAADLEDGALAGVAASFRRLASWAAAGELAAVAQIASRSARSDRRAEVDAAGRPDRVTADASGQVALALAMSHDGATSWADLGVMLTWRLPATGAALAAGQIDLGRARMIVRMTSPLSDDAARQVEAAVLGRAGWLTLGQLHAALRRAVIKADPDGAERRRRQAERNATVALYPEDEGTATLAGYSLPGVEAAAAMARITALAKTMKAAGSDGQIDWLRAHVFLGLLLGTLPFTPPADTPPPDTQPPAGQPDAGPPDPGSPDAPDDEPGSPGSPGPWPGVRPYLPSWLPAASGGPAGPAGLLSLAVPARDAHGRLVNARAAVQAGRRHGRSGAATRRSRGTASSDPVARRRDELCRSSDRGRPCPAIPQSRSTAWPWESAWFRSTARPEQPARTRKSAQSEGTDQPGQSDHRAHRAGDAGHPSRRACSRTAGTGSGLCGRTEHRRWPRDDHGTGAGSGLACGRGRVRTGGA